MTTSNITHFIEPDDETVQNLDESLNLLGRAGNDNNSSQNSHHAFQYATILLSHRDKRMIADGIRMMEQLTFAAWNDLRRSNNSSDFSSSSAASASASSAANQHNQPDNRQIAEDVTKTNKTQSNEAIERARTRDTLIFGWFLLAVGHYKLGDYSQARGAVESMLKLEPHHPQGVALRDKIDEVVLQKAAIGVGAVVVGALGAVALLRGIFGSGRG